MNSGAESNPKLAQALAHAEQGRHIFPVVEQGKKPAITGWQEWATLDAAKIKAHWSAHPEHNIGISTAGLLAVDVDGAPGEDTIRGLEAQGFEFPETYTQRTPRGWHFVYSVNAPVRQGTHKLGPNVDIRSRGGYIVAAGSKTADGEYTIEDPRPPVSARDWLIARCGKPRDDTPPAPAVSCNQDRAQAWAEDYLRSLGTVPIGQRNDTLNKAAALIRGKGLSFEQAKPLLQTWGEGLGLTPEETAATIRSAYTSSRIHEGGLSAEFEFSGVPVPSAPAADTAPPVNRFRAKAPHEFRIRTKRDALIADLIDPGTLSILVGQPGVGKSWVALSMAVAVASGAHWFNRATRRGLAIYIAAEAPAECESRALALMKHLKVDLGASPLRIIGEAPNLIEAKPADIGDLIAAIKAAEVEAGHVAALVIVDTLNAVMPGGDENSSRDMGAVVARLQVIARSTGAHVMAVHHLGKDATRGARGHSSLHAAADTVLEVDEQTIRIAKQRGRERGKPIGVDLVPIAVRIGDEDVSACLPQPLNRGAVEDFSGRHVKPESVAGRALTVLNDLSLGGQAVAVPAWRDEFVKRHYNGDARIGGNAFRRAQSALMQADRLVFQNDRVMIRGPDGL